MPFADDSFDIALCSHSLFLYSEQFTVEFHVASILELCRVSPDVRVFPLVDLGGSPSRHLDVVLSQLQRDGFLATVDTVPYEFQRGGNRMLRVRRQTDFPIIAKV